jgi:hypothetical protein
MDAESLASPGHPESMEYEFEGRRLFMSRGIPANELHEFFSHSARWAASVLGGEYGEPRRLRSVVDRVRTDLRPTALALASACDQGARVAASRFWPPVRARIYAALLDDRRGWLAQASVSAPGAILFALALLDEPATSAAGHELLETLRAGRRLMAALGDAVDAWSAQLGSWSTSLQVISPGAAPVALSPGSVGWSAHVSSTPLRRDRRAGVASRLHPARPPSRLRPTAARADAWAGLRGGRSRWPRAGRGSSGSRRASSPPIAQGRARALALDQGEVSIPLPRSSYARMVPSLTRLWRRGQSCRSATETPMKAETP